MSRQIGSQMAHVGVQTAICTHKNMDCMHAMQPILLMVWTSVDFLFSASQLPLTQHSAFACKSKSCLMTQPTNAANRMQGFEEANSI